MASWERHLDDATGAEYFFNRETNESTWENPVVEVGTEMTLRQHGRSSTSQKPFDGPPRKCPSCERCVDGYDATKEWWQRKKEQSFCFRATLRTLQVSFFVVKLAWAIYLSYIVSGYYQEIRDLREQLDSMNTQVRQAESRVVLVNSQLDRVTRDVVGMIHNSSEAMTMASASQIMAENTTRSMHGVMRHLERVTQRASEASTLALSALSLTHNLTEDVQHAVLQAQEAASEINVVAHTITGVQSDLSSVRDALELAAKQSQQAATDANSSMVLASGIRSDVTRLVGSVAANVSVVSSQIHHLKRSVDTTVANVSQRMASTQQGVQGLAVIVYGAQTRISEFIHSTGASIANVTAATMQASTSAMKALNESAHSSAMVADLNGRLAVVRQDVVQVAEHVSNAMQSIAEVERRSSTLWENLTILQGELHNSVAQVGLLQERSSALSGNVTFVKGEVASSMTQVDHLQADVNSGRRLLIDTLAGLNITEQGALVYGKLRVIYSYLVGPPIAPVTVLGEDTSVFALDRVVVDLPAAVSWIDNTAFSSTGYATIDPFRTGTRWIVSNPRFTPANCSKCPAVPVGSSWTAALQGSCAGDATQSVLRGVWFLRTDGGMICHIDASMLGSCPATEVSLLSSSYSLCGASFSGHYCVGKSAKGLCTRISPVSSQQLFGTVEDSGAANVRPQLFMSVGLLDGISSPAL